MLQRVKTVQESDLRMLGNLARNIQRVLPVTQADIDAAAALGEGWVVWKVFEVSEPLDNMRGGTQLIIRQNSVLPGQNVRRVIFVSGPGGQTVVIRGTDYIVLPDAIANSLSYVKAFGGTEQRDIPDNYLQRQFIYMMDGSYLLTDIVPTYDGRIEMDFQTTSVPASSLYFLGGRTIGYGGLFFVRAYGTQSFVVDAFGTGSAGRYESNVDATANTRYKFTYNNQVATLESGGSVLFTNTFSNTNDNGAALVINGLNSSGTITPGQAGIYLYSFKAWNAQGELVADYVPAVQKGTVPVVGFYDTVSGTFKTATAGTFAAGPEATPTPDKPMNIVSNNGVLKARHQSGLLLRYQQVEWISSNAKIIITGFKTKDTQTFKAKFIKASANSQYLYASDSSSSGTTNTTAYISASDDSGGNWRFGGGAISFTTSTNVMYETTQNKNGMWVNGSQVGTYSNVGSFTSTSDLGALSSSSSATPLRLYYLQVEENGIKVLDLVPVKDLVDNTYGLYNLVDGQFYTNTGATITAGDPVSDPVEIYTDGTVETINVHGKNLFDKTTYIAGKYYNSSGNIVENSAYGMSGFIPMKSGQTFALSGRTPSGIAIFNTSQVWQQQAVGQSFTAPYDGYFVVSVAAGEQDTLQVEQGSTATTYEPYYDGGTATAEMLLKVGDYTDVQSILDGVVTRNVGVKVLDGTESWQLGSSSERPFYLNNSIDGSYALPNTPFCTHFQGVASTVASLDMPDLTIRCGYAGYAKSLYIKYKSLYSSGVDAFKQYLADQYAAGTPVTIVYPLATETTESVAGQTLQVQDGDNTLTITQASLSGLELEAEYQKVA